MAKVTSTSVSVVITVFNEQESISELISALSAQTLSPKEIIVVDGGSTDNTFQILQNLARKLPRLKVFQSRGNRSIGRNYGVSKSTSSIIAFTDAGCIPEKNWLKELIKPFSSPTTTVVSGYYSGLAKDDFQSCLIPYVLVMPDKAEKGEFFPSTRSMALRRAVWIQSGGFDSKLSHNEDYVYAHWLKKMGVTFTFAPKAIVGWLPRKNLAQAFWMFLRFAIGDAQAGIIRPKVKILITRYLVFCYLFFIGLQIKVISYFVAGIMASYLFWSVSKNYKYVNKPAAILWLPVLQISSDLAVIFGTLMGLMTRT